MIKSCPLCRSELLTKRYYEDDRIWIADCLSHPDKKIVVLKQHIPIPTKEDIRYMLRKSKEVLGEVCWRGPHSIKDHFHLHEKGDSLGTLIECISRIADSFGLSGTPKEEFVARTIFRGIIRYTKKGRVPLSKHGTRGNLTHVSVGGPWRYYPKCRYEHIPIKEIHKLDGEFTIDTLAAISPSPDRKDGSEGIALVFIGRIPPGIVRAGMPEESQTVFVPKKRYKVPIESITSKDINAQLPIIINHIYRCRSSPDRIRELVDHIEKILEG